MKKQLFYAMAALCCGLMAAFNTNAQDTLVVEEESISMVDVSNCKTNYAVNGNNNWFIQMGVGINLPLFENYLTTGDAERHITITYNGAIGRWFSPYMAFRLSAYGGAWHWDNVSFSKAKFANANFDFMWDMLNSINGVKPNRPVSIIPFVGVGGTYVWNIQSAGTNVSRQGNSYNRQWALPLSAGIQFRFRLCQFCDLFLEGRASFYGDNVNGAAINAPIDVNIQAIGGLSFNLGGVKYQAYNACKDMARLSSLNNQVNDLRAELAATAAALVATESQLPCPEVVIPDCPETPVVNSAPLMSTVRFRLNSSEISDEEMVNVYNIAEYLKNNPDVNVMIKGYADKDTGTAEYNKALSERRAKAVYDELTKKYDINPRRLSMNGEGSSQQPYPTNNWNRIVIFVPSN